MRTLNPAADVVEIPDAGHFVMMEKPAEVNAALVAFAAKAGAIPMRALRPGRPEDVASREAIVKAVYDTISGPAGKRDWDRFRSLFADGARLIPVGPRAAGDYGPRVLDPDGLHRALGSVLREGRLLRIGGRAPDGGVRPRRARLLDVRVAARRLGPALRARDQLVPARSSTGRAGGS